MNVYSTYALSQRQKTSLCVFIPVSLWLPLAVMTRHPDLGSWPLLAADMLHCHCGLLPAKHLLMV
jgi:hypothetical protein